jgi:hypothetical protein
MIVSKKLIAATLLVAAVGSGVVATAASAATSSATGDSTSSLVQKIADTFHLNSADVQKVFDQNKAQRQADHQQKIEDRLTQAVKDGKLTEDQKTKLLTKLQDMQAAREAARQTAKTATKADRRAAMEKQRADFQQWLKDNGITNLDSILPNIGGPGPMGDASFSSN